ncbi:MAG: glucose 1-dehydrogenase [Pirellulales bacterium]|nr:glucose 1-dehydrogenase [Pirellulales bacterium]
MAESGKVSGKKVLVTGAGTGIGRETALEFARQGADVVVHYSHSENGALAVVAEIEAMGRRAAALAADFARVDQAINLGERAGEFLGGIDCLVNNAGISFTKPFFEVKPEEFDLLFQVNLRAQFFLTQSIARQMLDRGGSVCNVTSVHGIMGASEYALYSATKGAIVAYTRSIAVELAHRGIRVNAIAPGWVTVENYAKAIPDYDPRQEAADAAKIIPRARAGKPIDIAKLAVFLCSDDADFIVGQTIAADGGSAALLSLKPDFRTPTTARWGAGYIPNV